MKRLFTLAMFLIPAQLTPQTSTVPVNVTILVDGGEVVPTFTLLFTHSRGTQPVSVPMDNGFGNAFMVLSVAESDRALTLALPEGECHLTWSGLPENYSVQSIAAGSLDLRKSKFTVARNGTPRVVIRLSVEESRGRAVTGNVNGLPLPVLAARPPVALLGENRVFSTRLKPDGSFEFPRVPPGNYLALVAKTLAVQPSSRMAVAVAGKDVTGVRIDMPPLKEVRGRVTVDGIGPLRQVIIHVTLGSNPRAISGAVGLGANGTFRILVPEGNVRIAMDTASLPVGYTLRSFEYGATNLLASPFIQVSRNEDIELRAVVAVTSAGITIKLTDGTELLNSPQAPNAWVRVSGRVIGTLPGNFRPTLTMQSAQTRVVARGPTGLTTAGGVREFGATATMNFDGSFEFPKVTQGRYILSAGIPGFAVYRLIEVRDEDIGNLELVFPPRTTVEGRILGEGGGLLPRGYGFTLSNGDGADGGVLVTIAPGCNGTFRAGLPLGEYSVSTRLLNGYVSAFTYGSANLLRDRLRISENDDAQLRITFTPTATAGTAVIGGDYFGGANFSGLENGPPGPLIPPAGRGAPRGGIQAAASSETVVTGCVFVAGGTTGEAPKLSLRFTGASTVDVDISADGTFQRSIPKGEYRITLSALPSGYVLRSIKLGSTDLRREAVKLDDAEAYILVVLDSR
jgi:hypothetical protein